MNRQVERRPTLAGIFFPLSLAVGDLISATQFVSWRRLRRGNAKRTPPAHVHKGLYAPVFEELPQHAKSSVEVEPLAD